MTTYRLGISTCFAVKRWPQPERWAALVTYFGPCYFGPCSCQ